MVYMIAHAREIELLCSTNAVNRSQVFWFWFRDAARQRTPPFPPTEAKSI